MIVAQDYLYMQRCLDLAALATGYTAPNPLVGSVLVYHDRIIGEGYHHQAGTPHAEVHCFASVAPEDEAIVPESTLYVSLEPCSHYGKTPPCVALVLQKKVRRVVVAMEDPFPQVAGRSLALLRREGVEVEVGVLEEQARYLNRHFLTNVEKKRPWVTLKWAQSADGFVDRIRKGTDETPTLFSSPVRQRYVHRLRQEHDAILVGRSTVEWDNPALTNRLWWGQSPRPVILDSQAQLYDKPYKINRYSDGLKPWFVVAPTTSIPFDRKEQFIPVEQGADFVAHLLDALYARDIRSLLVEGGAKTLQTFFDSGLYDEVDREISPQLLHLGVPAPIF